MRRTNRYIHNQPNWPTFQWDQKKLAKPLASVRHQQGRLIGHMEALGLPLQQEAVLQTLTEDIVKSSEIEGETLDVIQVRYSIARRLGMDVGGRKTSDRHVEGVVDMMLDATRHYDRPLAADRLFQWHASSFLTGRGGTHKIRTGAWRADRAGPIRVVSGPIGRERVYFEAPPAARLGREMRVFLDWFNQDGTNADADAVLKAGLAHLWFMTIHPFADGNGRIARAIMDLALARSERSPHRFYSMSAQIRRERGTYDDILEHTREGGLDVTPWMEWFVACLGRAIDGAQTTLSAVLQKARFWRTLGDVPINERQRLMLSRLLDGVEGNLTTSKWATIVKCSSDTALRDMAELVERGVLVRNAAGGRSTSYALAKAQ